MTVYDELVARGLIAQVTDEEEIIKGNHSSSNGSHVMCMW